MDSGGFAVLKKVMYPYPPSKALYYSSHPSFRLMNWIILIIASLFEIAFATCLGKFKTATGTPAMYWFAGFVVCMVISVYLLYKAALTLPVGTAYGVWTGLGAAGIVIVGIFVFKEPATFWRMFFLTSLILSIVGLKLVS